MRLSALVPSAAAAALLFAFTSADVAAKGGNHRSCAELQAMMDHGLTGGKHAGEGPKKRAKIEKKMRKKGCSTSPDLAASSI
ncbi:hypothetical protein RHEC894_CH00989 [Rhizobium sp. CIAT894]|uniref:hypothetical protein n=1 Tax=Rhizobium sp. CIAT894 TaxID=2020312 RepID=UPI000A1E68B1|nr:hypothetical protein [Rhizobium sp. CIAT894]ARM87330.1 hypothetical protein RHEC894_CH00989 [Rhizobium sp. CIAT894]